MRCIKLAIFAFAAFFAAANFSYAQDSAMAPKPMSMGKEKINNSTTIRGEVIDMACYLTKGEHGTGHADCAEMCIKDGLPVGILDGSGHVYLCLTAEQKSANSLLVKYAAKQVKVTGTVYSKGGMDLLAIDTVEPLDSSSNTK